MTRRKKDGGLSRRAFVGGLAASAVAARITVASAASSDTRATRLVGQMTLDEKIAMVHGSGFPPAGAYAGSIPANTRLGIPALVLGDGPDGVGNGSIGVTQWPAAANQASSWDVALMNEFGRAYGAEQAGKGRNVALAPTINILRRPNWGRAFETYTEDPYLNGALAASLISGVQSNHVIATVKHFAGNNQEVQRTLINDVVSRRALETIYYPGFRAAVQQGGVGAVMGSYNKVNGYYSCENPAALTDALRGEWGYTGLVMSDWFATHSTVAAADAGLDMEMPADTYFGAALKAAVQNGKVSEAKLDTMVTRILTSMLRIGLFAYPTPDPSTVADTNVSTPAHLDLATRLSEQGTVLLKNDRGLLPLDPAHVRSIAVIGDAASAHPKTAGGGSASVNPSQAIVSPLAGITSRVGSGVTVTYARGTLGTAALTPIPASAFGSGLTGTYYPTADFTGTPIGTQTDANLDFTGTPAIVGSAATWSAVWTGTLTAPASGDYRFCVSGGGTAALSIDDTTVVSFVNGYDAVFNGLIHLGVGAHTVKATFTPTTADFFSGSGLQVGWQPQEDLLIAEAVAAAKAAEVAIVVVSDATSEGMDRYSLALPADQDKLIEAVVAANPRTIVVLNTSAAVLMPWLREVPAVLEAWYGGQNAGTALAAILFGDVNPSGKLAHTFPASDRQGPARTPAEYPGVDGDVHYDEGILVGYRWYDAKDLRPLFSFGHGLSYTTFCYSDLRVEGGGHGEVRVSATVANGGRRAGAEVAQLYLSSPEAADEAPKQLKGFSKVALNPGERRTLTFVLSRQDLSTWSDAAGGWTVFPGRYGVLVGGAGDSLPLRGQVAIS
ncbi:MAG TPA: glycoside hydrolase family 3 C-terminal domain-containing protein [Actinospica sp.]|nr:glycoside hydrolase family 3 C-terminal domain-containing protein [Actinospica sp.]